MKKNKKKLTVIERFMQPNPQWHEGYRSFNQLFGRPLGWLYLLEKDPTSRLIRLDRKDHCPFYAESVQNQRSMEAFLIKYCEVLASSVDSPQDLPSFYKDSHGRRGAIFAISHLGKLKGFLLLCSLTDPSQKLRAYIQPFDYFLSSQVELAYKTFELNNFYETVHPRALALSTMHSVHRVISSSIRLTDLLPRIGRLSAQVLKATGCSIMLIDPTHEYLLPCFSFGENPRFVHRQRLRVGRGLEGHIASTGEFHLTRRSIAVPFIEEDVVGVIVLWDKSDNQPFTKTDLEILKSLSEQAVVAIKNAQLFEETEQLTLGSIKAINELMELNFGGDRSQLPVFAEIVLEIGREMDLSSRDLIHLQRAVFLRDTGALGVPEQVLHKKGKLTKKELAEVKRIPMRGASLLRSISSLKPVIPIILHHRERFDGKGYPQGLKGDEIPIGARIVSVVDSFVAMSSKRAYRDLMSIEQALKEIKANRGTQFDPRVVDSFIKVVQRKSIMEKVKRIQQELVSSGKR
ncbi:MAG: HD domain-containing phosphohydrolase [Candidatus Omnitrophota bacterium]|nr:HD domain-containing phosphohydrolase [Candidatus Omnitrophota bacterium]